MKDDQKDNRVTNNQDNRQDKENKPNLENTGYPSQEPATDADPNTTKNQKEIPDTDHEHSYSTPTDDKSVAKEQPQNSNPGKSDNSDQNMNQPS